MWMRDAQERSGAAIAGIAVISVLGLCLGCELYGFLVRRRVIGRLHGFDVCVGGACAVPDRSTTSAGADGALPSRLPEGAA